MIAIILGSALVATIFLLMGLATSSTLLKIPMYIMAGLQILLISYMMWQDDAGNSITNMLSINFKMLLIIWVGASLIGIFMFMYHVVNVDSDEKAGDDKWLQAGEGSKWQK